MLRNSLTGKQKSFLRSLGQKLEPVVMMGKEGFEVTTYRIDGKYSDNRHPDRVEFTASLEEDLKRRDFTINAMAYNDSRGLIDL
ncbi:MAG: hypothetical protein II160_02270, partial [Selenomonas sp.]|nr:hypothetical protein [Selenomonas sp.]